MSGVENKIVVINRTDVIPTQIRENTKTMYQILVKKMKKIFIKPLVLVATSVTKNIVVTETITENSPVKFRVDGKDIFARKNKTVKKEKSGTEKAKPLISVIFLL